VVVFDGWKAGAGTESTSVTGGVKVVYSRLGEKADSVIKRLLSSERREWIVVSSDREIAAHAWATGSVPIGAEQFLAFLEPQRAGAAMDNEGLLSADEDEPEGAGAGRGRGRQLSKKEKAIRRALGKL
jgi:predicted RNA-binding protein with PIN domain